MKRLLVTLASAGLLVGLAAGPVAAAPGGVDRYEVTTTNYMLLVYFEGVTYTHSVDVALNPCDSTITMTGVIPTGMTVVGTLNNGVISFDATYASGQIWGGNFPVAGGGLNWWVDSPSVWYSTGASIPGTPTFSAFTNHGDYVSSMGGGADAAHSCIGMPMH
jgi:hypothetical protein